MNLPNIPPLPPPRYPGGDDEGKEIEVTVTWRHRPDLNHYQGIADFEGGGPDTDAQTLADCATYDKAGWVEGAFELTELMPIDRPVELTWKIVDIEPDGEAEADEENKHFEEMDAAEDEMDREGAEDAPEIGILPAVCMIPDCGCNGPAHA